MPSNGRPKDPNIPNNLEAERALLGSILLDNTALDVALEMGLEGPAFWSESHRITWQGMNDLAEERHAIDLVTLSESLSREGLLERAGGAAYLAALTDGVPIGAVGAVREYVRIVREYAARRTVLNMAANLQARVLENTDNADDLIALAQAEFADLKLVTPRGGFVEFGEGVRRDFGTIDKMLEPGGARGLATGLVDLDNLTGGLQNGELIIVAARPSLGKTALALGMAAHVAIQEQKRVGIFSLEMGRASLTMRLLAAVGRVDLRKMRNGFASRDDWNRVTYALGQLTGGKLYIEDAADLKIGPLRAAARRLKLDKDIGLLVVDYLQLVEGVGENRSQQVGSVSRQLKALAKELKIPVLALAQMSRAFEVRMGKDNRNKPMLSDLRESGGIEQDADVVVFIYRDKKPAEGEEEDPHGGWETWLEVAKQRNGPVGKVEVVFLKQFVKFENKAHEFGAEPTDAKMWAAGDDSGA